MKTSYLVPFLSVLSLATAACDPADDTSAAPDAGPTPDDRCDVHYADVDGDHKGDPSSWTRACAPAPGWVDNSDDCDDDNPYVNADEEEVCDGVDNDCRATTGEVTLCADQGCLSAFDPATTTSYLFCATQSRTDDDACDQHGFRPAKIESQAENDFLVDMVQTLSGRTPEGVVVVLGGTSADGVWRWADGQQFWPDPHSGAAAPYTSWLDGEPRLAEGDLKCMGLQTGGEVGWISVRCGRGSIVCERGPAP
jgi:hypothetical protein